MATDIAATSHVALYGIYFDHDKADLKPESAPTIRKIATLLKQINIAITQSGDCRSARRTPDSLYPTD